MKVTKKRCPDCGDFLVDRAGVGEHGPNLKCVNPNCPRGLRDIKCPKCGSTNKEIQSPGISEWQFTCKKCGYIWEQ